MTSPWLYALTVGPLGFYLWVLALWQSDRHPRVVRGLVDFSMLAFAVGGLLAFGPFGQLLTRMLFSRPDLLDRMAIVSGLGLWACLVARGAVKRLVVYNVDAERLSRSLDDVLNQTGGHFVKTLEGFEDVTSTRAVTIEFTRRLRCAVVEARGRDPEGLIQAIRPRLALRLREVTTRPTPIAVTLYGCSVLVMLVPLIGMVLAQPMARAALRVLLERLRGG